MPPHQHSTYNWRLALLWVSVMHTLTRSSITVSRVLVSVYFYGLVRCLGSVSFHGLLLEVCTIICLDVNRHLVSGHEISRLQHGVQLIMARYTRIINCRPCCNLYLFLEMRAGDHVSCFQYFRLLSSQFDYTLSMISCMTGRHLRELLNLSSNTRHATSLPTTPYL